MLVLTRRVGETIVIGDNIEVTVVAVQGDKVRIGVTAPKQVPVDRQEVHARRAAFVAPAAPAPVADLVLTVPPDVNEGALVPRPI
jgi:carbon storage regulator